MPWSDWIRRVEVEPSLYGADFSRLGEQIDALLDVGCRVFHFDVGDGHFIEPVTMGPIVLQWISPRVHASGGVMDVHLMVERPSKYFDAIAAAGGDSVTFHLEAVADVGATIAAAHERGLQAGVAFSPETEPEEAASVAGDADIVLCMAIHPGYSGQPFREETFERVERLRAALPDATPIQVDGGVSGRNIRELRDRGVTLFVAASAIFARPDQPAAYRELVDALA
jgi:ribulose-phosphate 3-epimerase